MHKNYLEIDTVKMAVSATTYCPPQRSGLQPLFHFQEKLWKLWNQKTLEWIERLVEIWVKGNLLDLATNYWNELQFSI